jgi:circadian clock protein KaiC
MNLADETILHKSSTGINGLDEITNGGLPKGRTTLVTGSAGSGKTLLAMEFLIRGASEFNEPGVFMAFEETEKELITNVSSLGFGLDELVRQKKIILDHIHIDPKEIEETGDYDLEGLFIRLGHQIDSIGAKRVVLDTIETLFSGFTNPTILRAELRRLFQWLKIKNVTAIVTGERGENALTRQGLEEYVSDCVILLDHRVFEESSTRRLRIIKYRGSKHGTNEYPFLIDDSGFSVLPITSLGLDHKVSNERISSGIPELDNMMGDQGFYVGSSILVSGTTGTGKSSIAGHFTDATCKRGEKVVFFSLEESPHQIIRNMNSIGIDLETHVKKGLLLFNAMRPSLTGLEMHLGNIHNLINKFKPSAVVLDPVNSFITGDNIFEARSMTIRLIDFLKTNNVTAFFTYLSIIGASVESNFISSLIDTWIILRDNESAGVLNHHMLILKSRGMPHSNKIRKYSLTNNGLKISEEHK